MKKQFLTLIVILVGSFYAQGQDFEQGNFQVKGGLGGPNWVQLGFNVLPNGQTDRDGLLIIPEIKAEYFVHEKMAVGVTFNYMKTTSDLYHGTVAYDGTEYTGRFGLSYQRYTYTLHAEYHPGWFAAAKIDLYVGGMGGIRVKQVNYDANTNVEEVEVVYEYFRDLGLAPKRLDKESVKQRFGLYAGVQFPIAEPVGFYFETGIGKPLVASGIKVKF